MPNSHRPGDHDQHNGGGSDEFDRRIKEFVETRLTDERLAREWEIWSGQVERRSGAVYWRQWILPRFVPAAAVLVIAGVVLALWLGAGHSRIRYEARLSAGDRSVGKARLPKLLETKHKARSIVLEAYEEDVILTGAIAEAEPRRGILHPIIMHGSDSTGVTAVFRGNALFADGPLAGDRRHAESITLDGKLEIPGYSTNEVRRTYVQTAARQ